MRLPWPTLTAMSFHCLVPLDVRLNSTSHAPVVGSTVARALDSARPLTSAGPSR